jgi:hypothetical protein
MVLWEERRQMQTEKDEMIYKAENQSQCSRVICQQIVIKNIK